MAMLTVYILARPECHSLCIYKIQCLNHIGGDGNLGTVVILKNWKPGSYVSTVTELARLSSITC